MPQRRRWPWIVSAVVLILLALPLGLFFGLSKSGDAYQTEVVSRRDVEETIIASGKIQPRLSVDVGAQVSGQLRKLHVRVGDVVKQGDLLAEIDADAQAAKVEGIRADTARLNAELAELQAAYVFHERQFHRHSALSKSNAVAEAVVEEMRRDMDVASARIAATRAKLQQTKASLRAEEVALSYARILAPISGTVVTLDVQEGQTLNANYETPLILRISDLTTMTVWTEVSEADVISLFDGMPVRFTTLGDRSISRHARLKQILPAPLRTLAKSAGSATSAPKSNAVFYTSLFDVENSGHELRAEMTAQVEFVRGSAKQVIAVPAAAIVEEENAAYKASTPHKLKIRILESSGKVTVREIATGIRNRRFVEVKGGVEIGERVVTGKKQSPTPSSLRIEK